MYLTIVPVLALQDFDIKGVMPFILLFLVLYLFMIRPQVKRQKNEKKFQNSLTKGAKVITNSGIHGKVLEINQKDNTVVLETGAGKIKFEKTAISFELSKKYQIQK